MQTEGFYKNDQGVLAYAETEVINSNYHLHRSTRETTALPVDGWDWFENETQARQALDLPKREDVLP